MMGTYYSWQRLPKFETNDGRTLYPFYADGVYGTQSGAGLGQISAYSQDTDLATGDIEHSLGRHQVGFIHWVDRVVQMVSVEKPGWERQGIATELWRLARELEPELQHSDTHISAAGAAWIASLSDCTDPQERVSEQESMLATQAAQRSWWRRLLRG